MQTENRKILTLLNEGLTRKNIVSVFRTEAIFSDIFSFP